MTTRRPPSPAGAGQRKRRPPARGVAAPAGEALRESPTTPLSRRSWRRWGFVANRAGSARRRFDPGPQRFGDAAGQPGEYPGSRMATGASAAILVLLTTLALLVDGMLNPVGPDARAGTSGPVTASEPAAETDASAAAKTGGAGIGAVPSSGGVARPPVTLAAAYRTERHVVGGYEAVVTINNLSTQPVDGWSVRIVLPPFGLVVRAVEGAKVEQTEKEVRFSPVAATRVIPAGQPTHFTFQVRGVGAPIECEINDQPCSGVPE